MQYMPHEWIAFRLVFGLFFLGAGFTCSVRATDSTSSSPAPTDSAAAISLSPEVVLAMEHLEPLWESMRTDIASCEATFRMQLQVTPSTPLNRLQVHEMLARYDLNNHMELAPDLFQELLGPGQIFSPPVRRYFEQGALQRSDLNLMSYYQIDNFSFISDGDNKQIRVYERGLATSSGANLSIFRYPPSSRAAGYLPNSAVRDGHLVRLTAVAASAGPIAHAVLTNTLDWATGIPVRREQVIEHELVQESLYFGLTTFAGGITFPRVAIGIRYAQDKVQSLELACLDEARFNEPLAETTFRLAKPAGWYVMDCRTDAGGVGLPTPREAVANVRTLIPASQSVSPSVALTPLPAPTSMSLVVRLLLVMNGAILIAIGVWMWRHASLKEQRH